MKGNFEISTIKLMASSQFDKICNGGLWKRVFCIAERSEGGQCNFINYTGSLCNCLIMYLAQVLAVTCDFLIFFYT